MAGYVYNPFTYKEYEESQAVKELAQKKAEAEKAVTNYGDFIFSKQGDYDSIYDQYKNRKDFSYDFNADALYQQYKDKYIEQGKMAMADTMGQAAAMTGGYGNSYAASVGNQAYQAQLNNLNDIIPELYQMAYNKYNQEGQDMLNMMAMLGDERNFEYGKWGDGYNRLVADRDYTAGQYDSEWGRDYGMYESDRTLAQDEHTNQEGYNYQNYRDAIADEQWQKNYELSERELAMAEDAYEIEKKEAGYPSKYDPVEATETDNTTLFQAAMRTVSEFNRGSNADKIKYGTYKEYIDAKLEEWYSAGKLNESELAWLLSKYGLV